MTTQPRFACDQAHVKSDLAERMDQGMSALLDAARAGASARALEQQTWAYLLDLGRSMLAEAFAARCRQATLDDLCQRRLRPDDVKLRMDTDYRATLTTTLGPVTFPLFAYREPDCPGRPTPTRVPARDSVFPLLERCRSSEVLVEWETRLGSEMPFRRAQQALTFFTHGAVNIEDTTLARHLCAVGEIVDRSWQYRRVPEIREILRDRAVRDADTSRPIVYASSDAHALRRYIGESWEAAWKMANGVRVWCIDRANGRIIHLGGEYTWGNCEEVEALLGRLSEMGILPFDGDYGDGLKAQVTWVTDGIPWIQERILPLYPGAICILDAWHLMGRLAKEAASLYGEGTSAAQSWYDKAVLAMFGTRPVPESKRPTRKRGGRRRRKPGAPPVLPPPPENHDSAKELHAHVEATTQEGLSDTHVYNYNTFKRFVGSNMSRISYCDLRRRGYQIGSGAMEALHRVASQARLKIAGARWLRRTSSAVFAIRMLSLVNRWDEFWQQPDLGRRVASVLRGM